MSAIEPPRRRRVDKSLVIVSLIVGLGLALVTRGLLIGVTGDDRSSLPDAIESVDPVPSSEQVLRQSSVFVDLADGYTGVLVIDGIEIETVDISDLADDTVAPGEQVEIPPVTVYEPGNATLTFTPSAGAVFPQFEEGEHTATVVFWRVDESRARSRTFSWTFNVL